MSKLSDLSESHDNNFNLIRFGAALGVFISHCFPLSGYSFGGKPQLLGFISLNVFFIISGFLVTKSYFNQKGAFNYLHARVLRVFPALFLAVIYSVFVIGAMFTTLPIIDYLKEISVYEYLVKNLLVILPNTPDHLPNVFLDSKYRPIVNAPLWSLPYEVWCYVALLILAILTSARSNMKLFIIVIVTLLVISYSVFIANYLHSTSKYALFFDKEAYRLSAMFLIGSCLYLFRNKIKITYLVACAILILIAVSSLYKPIFVVLTYASLGYLLLFFAYIPAGHIRQFNKLGDYSYGIYIFGYPTQQALEQVVPDLSLPIFFVISFSITLLLAVLSWHLIEKRALSRKLVG